jgi:hypothetical protein
LWLSCLDYLGFYLLFHLAFQSFDLDRTWSMLFLKGVVRTKLDIFVYIPNKLQAY